MSGRFHSDAAYLGLKAATRMLIREAGGLELASKVTRVERAALSRYENPNEGRFAPVDVVLDLEAANGSCHVTRFLAREQGHVLIELPRLEGTGEWGRHLGDIAKECGEAIAVVGQALAQGGTITAEEVRELHITREIDEAVEKLIALRTALQGLEKGRRK
ncbi:phage regulatory CII family protein [Parvibaculum sp.]|uniref:phage regulatory CII family protein n=1 Tax=Parvibaculum sp. TaxID=2024848 RepID=UPI003919118F